MSFLWSLGSFIVAIAILVAIHEYGHFWAARKCG
ncbi:MAG: site-2 protease family protein, partial [Haemophilus sp.]|nr:site-2 protease family protein [Haemophilus sp.]